MDDQKPNPGSEEAVALGCLCPRIDNHHGRGFDYPGVEGKAFWFNGECPLHVKGIVCQKKPSSTPESGSTV